MVKFATLEWGQKLLEHLNQDKEFKKATKGFSGTHILTMEKAPDKGFLEDKSFFVTVSDGEVLEFGELQPGETKKTDYNFKGSYENWMAVAKGELDPIRAITEKKFEILEGDVRVLLKYVKGIKIMISAIKDIETEF